MKLMHCRSSTTTIVFILSSSLLFANVRGFVTTTTTTSITTRFHEGQDFWAISHSSLAGIPPAFSIVDDDDDDDQEKGNDDTITSNKPYLPSDFTIEDDDDDVTVNKKIQGTRTTTSTVKNIQQGDDELHSSQEMAATTARPRRPRRPKKVRVTNWMEKNDKFTTQNSNRFEHEPVAAAVAKSPNTMDDRNSSPPTTRRSPPSSSDGPTTKTTFRQDFRGTRVFVQGIPPGISWQDLKDHFRVAGDVVFASISVDMETGMSKGHGIVQFETTQMAQNAINIMREHPLNGQQLFVREDYQDEKSHATLRSPRQQRSTPPSVWKCANEDNAAYMDEGELKAIESLMKARDDARKRKKFDVSDQIRDELKEEYGVFVDDRLKMWWTAVDGSRQVPKTIQDIKGDGRWKQKAWRQIPTTPENDACVDPNLVEGLLKQRDIARREKDFASADALLEQARTSPDGDLVLRIHDESRTWRIWTEAPPPRPVDEYERISNDPIAARKDATKQCIEIVNEFAPEKNDEILMLLRKFPGREFQMLKRLKKQYL